MPPPPFTGDPYTQLGPYLRDSLEIEDFAEVSFASERDLLVVKNEVDQRGAGVGVLAVT